MTLQGMYRIARDADALGEISDNPSKQTSSPVANRQLLKKYLKILKVSLTEIPVNVVDLGLIYRVEIEEMDDRGQLHLLICPYCTRLRYGTCNC